MSHIRRLDLQAAILVLSALLLFPLFGVSGASAARTELPPETVLVRVNGSPVTAGELEKFVKAFFLSEQGRAMWDETSHSERQAVRGDALQFMVDRSVLLSAAREMTEDKRQITAGIEETVNALLVEKKEEAGSRIAFIEELHGSGLTLSRWKEYQGGNVLVQSYLSEKTPPVHVRPSEMKEFYRRNRDRFRTPKKIFFQYIQFFPGPGESRDEVRRRAGKVVTLIEEGHCFLELARQYCANYSEDEDGMRVEEVPDHNPDWMPPIVRGIEPGEVSGLVEFGAGYIIGKLAKITPAGVKSFEEVQGNIRNFLMQEKIAQARERVVQGLREKADIQFTEEGKKMIGADAPFFSH